MLAEKRLISFQAGKKMETARRDADSEVSLPPHEVPPAAAAAAVAPTGAGAGAACPAPAKSGWRSKRSLDGLEELPRKGRETLNTGGICPF